MVLAELGKRLESVGDFEISVGRNGKVWVDCANAAESSIKASIVQCDENNLNIVDQKKLVTKVLRELKLDS
ncbi:Exosome complex exonuclease Rrp40 [Penicillium taxi]|uniref:Exosome complex exonuclease Rrp40 n=1 Tax=Penicillium taxi TaxID=168475 RepID=UPI002545289A|nr:Exosome complex exonuclease Rrp40 [Penicillium taxi]KAJ5908239.1 Exosome complex exonuclease Rrp40 [Penicillium taxi]